MYLLAQVFGILSLTIWIVSIKQKNRKQLALYQTISNATYSIQYALLQATSASCMNLLSCLRCCIVYDDIKNKRKTSPWVLVIFSILMIIVLFFTYNGCLSLIPVIITLSYAYSLSKDNILVSYWTVLIAAFVWIIFNYYVGAYISLFGNLLEIVFAIRSINNYNSMCVKNK